MITQKTNSSLSFFILLLMISFASRAQKTKETSRKTINFDQDWRFLKEDASGAEAVSFDDSKWRKLDVPHDWSIEGPYDKANPTSRGGGYLPAGIGWYRKSFTVNTEDAKQKFRIEFDGVMANSEVWINGFRLGKRPYGYISFSYDLTGHLKSGKGETNILAVKADNSVQPASRYYTGAGIYRHVRLVVTNPVHTTPWGIYVSTSQVTDKKATVNLQSELMNETSATNSVILETSIFDPAGKLVKNVESKQTLQPGKPLTINQSVEITSPQLWNLDQPNLYKAVTKIRSAKNILDEVTTTFGIRNSKFEAATGYWLNGKNIKIKGVCLHHDVGAFGSAVPLRAWEHRLGLLREVGVNAIRTAHNPVAPEFLDLCDRMGYLVMDETFDTWTAAKPNGEKGYNLFFTEWWDKDTRDMVLRDRNHPSIIIYSVGNEIHDNLNDSTGFKKYKDQQDLIHQLDPSRPVTMALFRPNVSKVYSNGFIEKMDIVGQNYRENELVDIHKAKPNQIVIGTENGHTLSAWLALRDNAFMSGQFLWAGVDYLGLKAVAKNNGKVIASDELKTAGDPVKIILTADKSKIANNWDDCSYITAKVVDANGIICPNADKLISFEVSGPGVVAAVDNGDVNSHEAYQINQRQIYQGQCIAIIKAKAAPGKITVTANSPELTAGSVVIEVN